MPFRFRRTLKLFPGLRLNLSKSGVSASLGERGAHLTLGGKGTRATVGLPGSGVSYTEYHKYPESPLRSHWLLHALVWSVVIAIAAAMMAPAHAATKKAQCFLQVDGVVRIDGVCDMSMDEPLPGDPPGHFEIGNGNFKHPCCDYGYFAHVFPKGDGTADAAWNGEDKESHAMDDLPTLHRQGACWVNGTTKICAWKIGEKRKEEEMK